MICTTVNNGDGYKVFMFGVDRGYYVTNPRGEQIVYPMIHQALNKICDMNSTWVQNAGFYRGCDLLTDKISNVYVAVNGVQLFTDYQLRKLEDARALIDHHKDASV